MSNLIHEKTGKVTYVLCFMVVVLFATMLFVTSEDQKTTYVCEIVYLDGGKDTTNFKGRPSFDVYDGNSTTVSAYGKYVRNVSRFKILKVVKSGTTKN